MEHTESLNGKRDNPFRIVPGGKVTWSPTLTKQTEKCLKLHIRGEEVHARFVPNCSCLLPVFPSTPSYPYLSKMRTYSMNEGMIARGVRHVLSSLVFSM